MRAPAVAGLFYPAQAEDLARAVDACFHHRLGPGALPPVAAPGPRALRALVVPHAGLAYSGPVAAHAYAALARDGLPEAVVVVGPSHAGLGGLAATGGEDWATPLGPMAQDEALRAALEEGGIVQRDDAAHADEHSIEVQLPFLQWLAQRAGKPLPWVPVAMGLQDEDTAREVGAALVQAIGATGRDVLLVASSDLMHAGSDYRVRVPAGSTAGAFVRERDAPALQAIQALDPDRLVDEVRRRPITMCGYGPVAAVLHAAKALGAREAEVLAHATSADVQPHGSAVGYGAVALR
jgi:MEMO1 family protein